MGMNIEDGDLSAAIKILKNECVDFDELTPYEVNRLAVKLVAASNLYDSASLISQSIDDLIDEDDD